MGVILGYSTPAISASSKLLILGDSLSAAYGMEMTKGWGNLLQQKLNTSDYPVEVVNASISGETTSGGKNRLAPLLKKHQPKWVIVELGANDALRGQNLKTTQQNLEQIIQVSQKTGAKVFLLGIRLPTNYGPAYDRALQKMYQRLADKHQLLFDPFFLMDVALDPDLMQEDGLHPNAQAQPIILNRLWPNIEKLLK